MKTTDFYLLSKGIFSLKIIQGTEVNRGEVCGEGYQSHFDSMRRGVMARHYGQRGGPGGDGTSGRFADPSGDGELDGAHDGGMMKGPNGEDLYMDEDGELNLASMAAYHDPKRARFLFYWRKGSGKSKGALLTTLGNGAARVLVICDNSMMNQWTTQCRELWIPPSQSLVEVQQYQLIRIMGAHEFHSRASADGVLETARGWAAIVDEIENFRAQPDGVGLLEGIDNATSVFILTSTPLCRDIGDFIPLALLMGYVSEEVIVL